MTELEVCDKARALLKQGKWGGPIKVRVWPKSGAAPVDGTLGGVSPVNAWVKVAGVKCPADQIKRLEEL